MMKRFFLLGITLMVSVAMLLTACKKEENSGNNNQETPGGSSEVTPNQEYPETAEVLARAVTDIDGNTYDAVQIGDQVWMAENLRTTRYADGMSIPMGSTYSSTEPYRYVPGSSENDGENMEHVAQYGYLYNWLAVMHGASGSNANPSGVQGVCPDGWHVPSEAEWLDMIMYLMNHDEFICGGLSGKIAKAISSNDNWLFSGNECAVGNDMSANNATGFSARPAGYFFKDGSLGTVAYLWSATASGENMARYIYFYYNDPSLYRGSYFRHSGYAVRCVRD